MVKSILASVVLVALSTSAPVSAHDDPKWLCVAEQATGFIYKAGRWAPTIFNVSTQKYIVGKGKQIYGTEDIRYGVTKIGEKNPIPCRLNDRSDDWLICGWGQIESFHINITRLRYVYTSAYGYASPKYTNENKDTPRIEIGSCSLL